MTREQKIEVVAGTSRHTVSFIEELVTGDDWLYEAGRRVIHDLK